MEVIGQNISISELIKDTSTRFGNGGFSRFISGVQNSSEQPFHCTKEQAEIFRINNFAVLRSLFRESVMSMDMTPFKNISAEIKVYRESQSSFSRFCQGRVLDKIQEKCTNIMAMNEYFSRLPALHRDTTVPDSAVYTTEDITGKYKAQGLFVLQRSLTAGKDAAPANYANPEMLTQVKIKTGSTVELLVSGRLYDKKPD
ncbi:hypothetical protein [Morganella psychrotolerans]|uniref:hypothetical protein n=1 Tax=Morganella psychrotolerans TaxID=368603 RepID=UPI0039AEE5AA